MFAMVHSYVLTVSDCEKFTLIYIFFHYQELMWNYLFFSLNKLNRFIKEQKDILPKFSNKI